MRFKVALHIGFECAKKRCPLLVRITQISLELFIHFLSIEYYVIAAITRHLHPRILHTISYLSILQGDSSQKAIKQTSHWPEIYCIHCCGAGSLSKRLLESWGKSPSKYSEEEWDQGWKRDGGIRLYVSRKRDGGVRHVSRKRDHPAENKRDEEEEAVASEDETKPASGDEL
jgi:hypothetical protein